MAGDYETATGQAIVARFSSLDPATMPAVLVAGHAPFTWGASPADSVRTAIALEAVAAMAVATWQIAPDAAELESYVREKHFFRKHGPGAYYGQQ